MKEQTMKILLMTVAALVLVYAGVAVASHTGGTPKSVLGDELGALDPASILTATLVSQGDTIRLQRRNGGWEVDGYAADSAMAAGFLSDLKNATVGRVASTNPANQDRLGVSTDSATVLELDDADGPAFVLLVGKRGSSYGTVYVRLPDQDEVRLLNANLGAATARDVDGWRDHTILTVDTASVARIEVTRNDTSYILLRGDSAWSVDGAPAPASPVGSLLRGMASFRADGFAPDSVRTTGTPARRLVAMDAAGDTLADLAFFTGGTDNRLRVTTAGGNTVFEVASWQADRITPATATVRGAQQE